MKKVKEAVPQETEAIRKRVLRSFAMGNILKEDCDTITNHLAAIDETVERMYEKNTEMRSF